MRPRILLIEDEGAQRELVRYVLMPRGFEVTEACTGRQGIVELERRDFDVIVTDLRMPDGSGEFVIEWILANRIHLRSRVLVVTGDLLSPGLEAFLTKVELPLLSKPYLIASLIESVEQIAFANGRIRPMREEEDHPSIARTAAVG